LDAAVTLEEAAHVGVGEARMEVYLIGRWMWQTRTYRCDVGERTRLGEVKKPFFFTFEEVTAFLCTEGYGD
jgi:hypothetical protein